MSTQTSSRSPDQRESPWAGGLTVVAAAFLVIAGVWHGLAGIAGIVGDEVYVAAPQYGYPVDLTVWGWAQLAVGALQVAAGLAVLRGRTWARVVGIVLAGLSMLGNFAFLPYFPVWSLLIIALDAVVIWALATHRRDAL